MVSKNNHQFYQQKHAERKQRWGIRKLSVGVASVLLGTTFMLYGNHAVLADTVTSPSDDVTRSTTTQGGNKDKVTEGTTEGTTSTPQTSGDSTDKQANGQNVNQQVPTTDTEEATNHQDTPQGQDTTQNTTNVDKKDTEVTPANDATTPTTQKITAKFTTAKFTTAKFTAAKFKVLAARPVMKVAGTASLPISNQDIKLDSQPMLTEIINKPTDNWVYNNLKWYQDTSTEKIKEILQNHTANDESGRYYFAGVANYNEHYHAIYLLARSNNLNDNSLYVTILHTGLGKNIQEAVVAPGESKKVEYSGTTHTPIFTNYDGTSASIDLDGIEKGDNIYGMVVGFAYGHNTGIKGDPASMGNGFVMTPIPTKMTTTIHYIDQATGDEIAVPKSFEGVAYQKYTITGEAPTIDGYTLKKSPETTGYISPYKVGESYDFRLDKHVVIKQTVIDAQGLVRVTAYYDGEVLNNTTRYLGNKLNVNDRMSFISHGKWYTYINQITSTNDGIVYYYAKDGSEDKSEVRVHYIDVTGSKNSIFVPGDGEEVATDKISGKLGENYNYDVNLPTDYNLATNQANTVNGTYTIDHHDEYVYVVKKTSAELDPTVPAKTKVDNPTSLTADEKKTIEDKIVEANKDKFPEGTGVTVANDGKATITYPDKSVDTIEGNQLVEEKTSAEKLDPTVPAKTKVDNPTSLTADEKKTIEDKIVEANKDKFPEGTGVTVANDGKATITYPDKSVDTIEGNQLVEEKTSAEKLDPTVPAKTKVDNPTSLTADEKKTIEDKIVEANKDKFPEGTGVTVANDGKATITYPDKSVDTIEGNQLVEEKTSAEKLDPTVPAKTKVDNPTSLTADEKKTIEDKIVEANKDKFPEGTGVTVANDGKATITYPDKSVDTIEGNQLVEEKTSAEKLDPTVPAKTKVDNPTSLTADEKKTIEDKIVEANKDKFPEGTGVTVANDGKATITYPDKSVDTIEGNQLVEEKTSAEKLDPTVPAKTKVDNPTSLTADEKKTIEDKIVEANKDKFPEGTGVTVANDGKATITYPDKSVDTIEGNQLVEEKTSAEKLDPTVPAKTKVDNPTSLTADEKKTIEDKIVEANKDKFPEGTGVTVANDGKATITYPDKSVDTIEGNQLVEEKTSAEKLDPTVPAKTKVDNPTSLTADEKKTIEDKIVEANKDKFPEGTGVTVANDGKATITYPDKSVDTIEGNQLVEEKTSAEKLDPTVPAKTKVDNPTSLTADEKKTIEDKIVEANKDKFPEGTGVTVANDGKATITYPDKSVDTIEGNQLVEEKTSAEKLDPTVPAKTKVDNPTSLTADEKKTIEDKIVEANKDKFPEGTGVTVANDGKATITYPDKSVDTIEGNQLVEEKTSAEKLDPTVPAKTKVDDPTKLTNDEKKEVEDNIRDHNTGLPEGTKIAVGDNGDTTITYPDKSVDTIEGNQLVEEKTSAEKLDPTVPAKTKVDDPTKLTNDEKKEVEDNIRDHNTGLPEGTKIAVGDNGDTTITYPDNSVDTIPGDKVVEGKSDAAKNEPKVPGDKVKVDDPNKLTEDEKSEVVKAVEDANKDENGKSTLPEGSKVTVGDNGDVTVTYPDGSKDTIPGDKVVEGKGTEGQTDADKNEPKVPGDKVKVDDPNKLTEDEKSEVVKAVEDANKDENGKSTLPEGSKVTVGDNGDVTVTYPDGSKDTIPGDKVVEGKGTEGQTDADKNEPKVPGDKVKVDDPNKLTEDEKSEVVKAVEDANKDENGKSTLPEGSKVTVGDNGDVTVTYPDGSKDTIPGDKVVEGRGTEGQTDADKNEPKVPGDKVKVDDPTKLTEDEKSDVEQAIKDANKDENGKSTLPEGSKVTVGDNDDVTVTYPDGSKDTIPGDKVVEGKGTEGQTDADKNEPKVPGDKVKVDDPNKLMEDEKSDVEQAIKDANKDENGKSTLPEGSKVTVSDNGDVTITYPDGSKDTIPGDQVIEGKSDADKNTPNVPGGDKVKVDDPTKLTDNEKNAVKDKVDEANSNLPDGTKVTVGDDGTTTITYPDGSTNTISGHDLVTGKTDADKYPLNPGQAVNVVDPNHLTQAEQDQVKEAIQTTNPTAPIATITVDTAGNVQVTFADGSTTTLQANLHKHVTEATTGSAIKPGVGTNGGQTKGATSTNQTATKQQAQQHLPQTGDQPATWAMLSGLGVAFLGLLGLKKKRED
ncbi:hypothetical protein IU404_00539 [Limosilactobacillus reuteri]|uniref:YSIRK-type signal peptide-containing protein n=1 Tax=Limosilactobacillus reuteri TaxID=1598 RepID=UPI001E4A64A0|nr:YSIRK-type signal peptide-containing protein [Limosilactobacillus reuteri]UFK65177.1 hypothetical protein IU404_00539 [Limosilactobacillus reuteri]